MAVDGPAASEALARCGLGALAVWRVAHLVVHEDGPFAVIASARARLGGGMLGELVDCFACTSVWAAVPAALLVGSRRRRDLPMVWLALSGAACLLERATQRSDVAALAWPDAEEALDGML